MNPPRNLEYEQLWLNAHTDTRAAVYTFSSCIALADLNADGDFKLIVADLGTGSTNVKLKVYKGTSLHSETALLDVPTGVVSFYMDNSEPRMPAIAVASGSNIYIYKNMRPYFKFSLPSMDVNPMEKDLWLQVRDDQMEVPVLVELLNNLNSEIGFAQLSTQSQHLLALDPLNAASFVQLYSKNPLKRQTVVTCITTLKKALADEKAVSCLVVGTESGEILVLDPEAFTILEKIKINNQDSSTIIVPAVLSAFGLHAVEFRIIAACRDGSLRVARRGWTESKLLVQLPAQPVAMTVSPENASITIALMNQTLQCISKKGKLQWVVTLPAAACALCPIPLPHQSTTLIAVSLNGGLLQLYNGRQLVDVIKATQSVSGLAFGKFGQEENALIMFTVDGSLLVKILKRTAHFNLQGGGTSANIVPAVAQQIKLQIPKKTRLFLDQTMRERDNCVMMHRTFQRDLFQLRVDVARACVKALQSCNNPISLEGAEPVKLSAQVLGLGPLFKMVIMLQNISASTLIQDVGILFHFDDKMYTMEKPFINVPMLVPGVEYPFETMIRNISELALSDQIRVLVVREGQSQPLLAAIINMPVCDLLGMV
ncbi:Bardet-Biedl syndrome 1 protein-like protein [Frankliniella fusca]|uniref:Bardet-Biedl syndrome 1 protein-like protein n=1 Tax=Frankliniella fusca TaxID=407009 RepID=A0AAE1I3X1_9NEOP|nr:Bardet-Biedl syndrome 1 protein-like protein [Frankliniella fusca]